MNQGAYSPNASPPEAWEKAMQANQQEAKHTRRGRGLRKSETGPVGHLQLGRVWIATTLQKASPKEDETNAHLIAAAPRTAGSAAHGIQRHPAHSRHGRTITCSRPHLGGRSPSHRGVGVIPLTLFAAALLLTVAAYLIEVRRPGLLGETAFECLLWAIALVETAGLFAGYLLGDF